MVSLGVKGSHAAMAPLVCLLLQRLHVQNVHDLLHEQLARPAVHVVNHVAGHSNEAAFSSRPGMQCSEAPPSQRCMCTPVRSCLLVCLAFTWMPLGPAELHDAMKDVSSSLGLPPRASAFAECGRLPWALECVCTCTLKPPESSNDCDDHGDFFSRHKAGQPKHF